MRGRGPYALAVGVGLGVGLGLVRLRGGVVGRVALIGLSVDVSGWMAPAAWSIARHNDGVAALLVPLGLVVLGASVIAAAWRAPKRFVALGAVAVFVAALIGGAAGHKITGVSVSPDSLTISSRHATFSTTGLRAHAGTVTVAFHNHDLFWHTFTSAELKVDEHFPVKADRTITVTAKPGVYHFYCSIPGHAQIGMKGTLTVK